MRSLLLTLAIVALAVPAHSQQPDTLRQRFLVVPPVEAPPVRESRAVAGLTVGTPVAFGADWGDVYAGAVAVDRQRYYLSGRGDGIVVVGFGLGDARNLVGLDVTLASYSTLRRGFLTRAGASFKLHRVLGESWGAAVGMENALTRGVDSDRSLYGAVTRIWMRDSLNPFPALTTTAGIGNGRFRSHSAWLEERDEIGVFGNAALYVARPVSFIADYSQDLNLGVSVAPLRVVPLTITVAALDVLGIAGDGRRYTVGVGTGFSLR
jgi:hypothetical protein